MKWIRLDTSSPRHPLSHRLSKDLNIPVAQAFGHYCAVCCGLGEYQEDGDLSTVPDAALEAWALWEGRKGRFALALRNLCQTEDGGMKGWWRQEKLRVRVEKDRERHRKKSGTSAETPRRLRRGSKVIPGANDTIRNGSSSSNNEEELHLGMFEAAWKAYPRRPGNSKADARKAWSARIRDGIPAKALLTGVEKYAAYVVAEQIAPKHVKMASTFFGPGEHYLSDYDTALPDRKIQVYMNDDGVNFTPEFLRAAGMSAPR